MSIGKDNYKQSWRIAFNTSVKLFHSKSSIITRPVFDLWNKYEANNHYYFAYMPNKHEEWPSLLPCSSSAIDHPRSLNQSLTLSIAFHYLLPPLRYVGFKPVFHWLASQDLVVMPMYHWLSKGSIHYKSFIGLCVSFMAHASLQWKGS